MIILSSSISETKTFIVQSELKPQIRLANGLFKWLTNNKNITVFTEGIPLCYLAL